MLSGYPDEENYLAAQRREGIGKGVAGFVKNVASVTPEQIDNTIGAIINNPRLSDEERQSEIKSLKKSGILNKDGSINHDPENYIRAMATYKAGTMTDDSRITIGGVTNDLDRDVFENRTRVTTNASQVHQTGDGTRYHTGVSGNYYQAGMEKATGYNAAHPTQNADGSQKSPEELGLAFAGGAIITGAVANGLSKQFTGKGLWGNVESFGDRLVGGKSSSETLNNSGNKSTNNHNNNSGHAAPDKSFKHNNTPSSDSNIHNYNTIDEVTQAKEKLHTMEPEATAKKAVKQSLTEAGRQYPKNSPQRTEIAQMQQDLRNGRPVDAQRFNELTGKEAPEAQESTGVR